MNLLQIGRAALVPGTLVLTSAVALAAGPSTQVFGGGANIQEKIDRAALDCLGTPINNETQDSTCTTPQADGYEYYYAGIGAGAGLTSLLQESPVAHSLDTGIVSTDAGQTTYPYPHWHFTASDAPLDSAESSTGPTYLKDPLYATVKKNRGDLWQFPVAASGLSIAFNPGTSSSPVYISLYTNTTIAGLAGELNLTKDQLCYIWTGADAKGVAVAGAYDWSNPLLVTGTTKNKKVTNPPAHQGLLPSGSTLAIQPVHRTDGSGATYILATWLFKSCKGYKNAGYGNPTNDASVFPANNPGGKPWLTAGSNSSLVSTVAANVGAISYTSPDKVVPSSGATVSAAFLATPASGKGSFTFLYPSPTNVKAAFADATPPAANSAAKAWGVKLEERYFKKATNSTGYPITSLSRLMGYRCYVEDTNIGQTETGILDMVNYIWKTDVSNAGSPTQVDNKITASGFVPMPDTFKESILTTLTGGGKYSFVAVPQTYVGAKPADTGPKDCKNWNNDNNRD